MGQAIFVGALVLTLLAFLYLLVTNPGMFIELHKSQREHEKERAARMEKAVKGGVSLWKLFTKK